MGEMEATIMEMEAIIMEMEAIIMEMVAGTMVTIMEVITMEETVASIMEMEVLIMEEMEAGTMATVIVAVLTPIMEVVVDQTQIMEIMATTMVAQIPVNKSKCIFILRL